MSFLPIGARVLIAMLAIGAAAEARLLNARYSSPAARSTLDGHNTQYVIRFDGWVDHESSRLEVIENEKLVQSLAPVLDSEPDALAASVPILPAGEAISSAGMPNPSRMAIFGRRHLFYR